MPLINIIITKEWTVISQMIIYLNYQMINLMMRRMIILALAAMVLNLVAGNAFRKNGQE